MRGYGDRFCVGEEVVWEAGTGLGAHRGGIPAASAGMTDLFCAGMADLVRAGVTSPSGVAISFGAGVTEERARGGEAGRGLVLNAAGYPRQARV